MRRVMGWIKVLLPMLLMTVLAPLPVRLYQDLREAAQAEHDGQPLVAAARFQDAYRLATWQVNALDQAGRAYFRAGDYEKSIQALEEIRRTAQADRDSLLLLALAYDGLGKCDRAVDLYAGLASSEGAPAEVFPRLVRCLRALGDLKGAQERAEDWARRFPQDPTALYVISLFTATDDLDRAAGFAEQAAQLDRRYSAARDVLRKAAELAALSQNPAYRWTLAGRALGNLGEWEFALQAFTRAVESAPEYAEARAFLGEARFQLGQDGLADLEKARDLDPNSVLAQAMLALYYGRQGDSDRALDALQKAALLEPAQAVWQVEIGNVLAKKGDLPEALAAFLQATKIEPTSALAWEALARFSLGYEVDLRSYGLPAARQAAALKPDDPALQDLMGAVLLGLEDFSSAERFFLRALELDPALAQAHLHLGILAIQTGGDAAAGQYHLGRAVSLDAQGATGQTAQRLLDRYYGGWRPTP